MRASAGGCSNANPMPGSLRRGGPRFSGVFCATTEARAQAQCPTAVPASVLRVAGERARLHLVLGEPAAELRPMHSQRSRRSRHVAILAPERVFDGHTLLARR